MTTEAETGDVYKPTKGQGLYCQQPLEAKRERQRTDSPSEPPRRNHPADTLILYFWPPEL